MDEQLSGGLGHIQAVLEEFVDRGQCLFIEVIRALAAEDLTDEHLAQRNGQLIDQTTDSQLTVRNNISLVEEDLAYIQCHLGFLIRAADFLDLVHDGAVCDADLPDTFLEQCSFQGSGRLLDLLAGIGLGKFLHYDHIALIHCGNEILAVGTEMIPRQFQDIVVLTACGFHDHNHPGNICLDMKLLGTTVNIHQQQVV